MSITFHAFKKEIGKYLALSRTQHILLDMAAPAFCALLWLGKFPDASTTLLSLLTAFAAYTSVYAINDVVGCRLDREKMAHGGLSAAYSVESAGPRHPLAQGQLTMKQAIAWASCWAIVAIVGAYLLNPVIIFVFVVAAISEVAYCLMLKVSCWRVVLSGIVKGAGPLSAVLVVDHSPSFLMMFILFAWVFFWELGGQNIPADWNDKNEDSRLGAKTIPVIFGDRAAGNIAVASSVAAVVISLLFSFISPLPLGVAYAVTSLVVGYLLYILPAWRLRSRATSSLHPARLFDMASHYPLAMLLPMVAFVFFYGA